MRNCGREGGHGRNVAPFPHGAGMGLDTEGSVWCSDSFLGVHSRALHPDTCIRQVGASLAAFGARGGQGWAEAGMHKQGPQVRPHAHSNPCSWPSTLLTPASARARAGLPRTPPAPSEKRLCSLSLFCQLLLAVAASLYMHDHKSLRGPLHRQAILLHLPDRCTLPREKEHLTG